MRIAASAVLMSFLLVSNFAVSAHAKNPPKKIAYVDINRVMNEIADGKAAKNKLKSEFEAKQQKLDKMQSDLKKEKESFDKRQGMMKQEVRQAQQEALQRKFLQLQQTYISLQKELMGKETKMTQEAAQSFLIDLLRIEVACVKRQ